MIFGRDRHRRALRGRVGCGVRTSRSVAALHWPTFDARRPNRADRGMSADGYWRACDFATTCAGHPASAAGRATPLRLMDRTAPSDPTMCGEAARQAPRSSTGLRLTHPHEIAVVGRLRQPQHLAPLLACPPASRPASARATPASKVRLR